MRKVLFYMLLMGGLASQVWAQNKIFSSTPSADSLSVKQLEVSIEFLQQELDRMIRLVNEMTPVFTRIQACSSMGMIYAPGAAGVGADSIYTEGCVALTGPPLVTEIQSTVGAIAGNFGGAGTPDEVMQSFINSSGCPTNQGWRVCSDDDIIFALDQRVGNLDPSTLLDGRTYWVRTLVPMRFHHTDTAVTLGATLNCSDWTSDAAPNFDPPEIVGTYFDGNPNRPLFNFGSCAIARYVLCCR